MKNTWEDIAYKMGLRREADSYMIKQMIMIRDRYNGDVIVPVPGVEGDPVSHSVSPQIIADGIDHTAMRAASVMPNISCPALTKEEDAHKAAAVKRRALYSGWYESGLDLLLYRAFRHFIGYGTSSLIAVPDFVNERSCYEIRDPLSAYPELRSAEDFHEPINVGFVFGRSRDWLARNYPECRDMINKQAQEILWDVVEWIDEDDIVLGVLGPRSQGINSNYDNRYYPSQGFGNNNTELKRWPNRAGMVPVACPRRATLDRVMGQLTHIIPSSDLLDRMTLLETIAAEKHVFPDMVILGKRTAMPTLQGGQWKDGREGEPNIVLDADGVQLLQPSVGPATFATMERLEKAVRQSGGVPELFGGANTPGLRTGRALDALGSFSVDPRVMEAQKFMQRALVCVTKGSMEVEKGYWPDKKYVCFSGWSGDTEVVKYTPKTHFKNTDLAVDWSMPGLDMSQVTVAVGQLVGAGLMSRSTARNRHPMIPEAGAEERQINIERIEDVVMQTFMTQAQQGALPLIDLVQIAVKFGETSSIVKAVQEADKIARERQAAQAPPPGPGQQMAPEGMPGLAAPGMGAESAAPPGAPPAGPDRMQALLAALQSQGGPPGA